MPKNLKTPLQILEDHLLAKVFGKWIRYQRHSMGMTQELLANTIGVSIDTVSGYENANHESTVTDAIRIVRTLGGIWPDLSEYYEKTYPPKALILEAMREVRRDLPDNPTLLLGTLGNNKHQAWYLKHGLYCIRLEKEGPAMRESSQHVDGLLLYPKSDCELVSFYRIDPADGQPFIWETSPLSQDYPDCPLDKGRSHLCYRFDPRHSTPLLCFFVLNALDGRNRNRNSPMIADLDSLYHSMRQEFRKEALKENRTTERAKPQPSDPLLLSQPQMAADESEASGQN